LLPRGRRGPIASTTGG